MFFFNIKILETFKLEYFDIDKNNTKFRVREDVNWWIPGGDLLVLWNESQYSL